MRRFLLIPLTAIASFPAGAQSVIQAPTAAVIVHSPSGKVEAVPSTTPVVTQAAPLEEIGFDPKVKRDPYGKPIATSDTKNGGAASTGMRNDSGAGLRSDIRPASSVSVSSSPSTADAGGSAPRPAPPTGVMHPIASGTTNH